MKRQKRKEAGEALKPAGDIQEGDDDYWLSPLNELDRAPLLGPAEARSVVASKECDLAAVNPGAVYKEWRHGFLPISLDDYLQLLDRVGRQVIQGKAGAIDAHLEPILERWGPGSIEFVRVVRELRSVGELSSGE